MLVNGLEISKEVERLTKEGSSEKEAVCLAYSKAYGQPQESLKLIGVTGTNGKTTVVSLITHILNCANKKCACTGTLDNVGYTTAPPHILFKQLYSFKESGCEYAVMEISSHGLAQSRVANLSFDIGVFTNISRDHLDYHGSMESYIGAKKKLFYKSQVGIINSDNEYSGCFSGLCEKEYTCSALKDADYRADNIKLKEDGVEYDLIFRGAVYKVYFPVIGKFSVYNSLCALAAANAAGVDIQTAVNALSSFNGVCGRAEKQNTGLTFDVYIDYAHTPDGLNNLLSALWPLCKGELIVVFGCGGDRDKGKRPLMLKAAAMSADFIIITSDNPRSESPYKIIKDIISDIGSTDTPFAVIEDRKKAIEFGMNLAKSGDILVIAGKGHEKYQSTASGKIPFDEREIVKNAARLLRSYKGDSI